MKLRFISIIVILLLLVSGLAAKDVFVAAGKSGNGTKEKPYGAIEQAFDMGLYAGDVLHVAAGVYYGKGGSGKFTIPVNNLTIVGGYNSTFTDRDPWMYRTILVRGMGDGAVEEAKKREHNKKWGLDLTFTKASYNGDGMVIGEGDSSNTIIDGFIIDGYTRNTYKSNGDLKIDIGPIGTPLVIFNKPGCKIRNCVILNSGGPGIRLVASGLKDDPATWAEISNCVIINTLMQAIDFRVGDQSEQNPDGGTALIKDNTIAFVWSHLGEGYGILIGRQTRLSIENNIIAFAADFGMNNGFGNDKAALKNNVFFNNIGGTYRYFAEKDKVTVVEDDPTLLEGKQAKKMYYLSQSSAGNVTDDPELKVDPEFFDKFSNQIKASGGGKVVWDDVNLWRSAMGLPLQGTAGTGRQNYAPVYEHEFIAAFSPGLKAGAKNDKSRLIEYKSAPQAAAKEYTEIKYAELGKNIGKDVTVSVSFNSTADTSSYWIPDITKAKYICYRSKDMNNFFYIPTGSESLEIIKDCIKDGIPVIVSGTIYDIKATIKVANKYGFVVDEAVSSDD